MNIDLGKIVWKNHRLNTRDKIVGIFGSEARNCIVSLLHFIACTDSTAYFISPKLNIGLKPSQLLPEPV
jgi:hypothetical protein